MSIPLLLKIVENGAPSVYLALGGKVRILHDQTTLVPKAEREAAFALDIYLFEGGGLFDG